VRAALALIDERGLDALTMRRLGADLGVEAMSLYKHVPSKDAILDGVRQLLLDEFAAALPAGPTDDWRGDLAAFARAYRDLGRAHPEAFGLLARGPERAYVAGSALAEAAIARLIDAGFDRETAIHAQRTVVRFVLGASLLEQAADDAHAPVSGAEMAAIRSEAPLVSEVMGSFGPDSDEALFEFGLDALLAGIAQRAASGTANAGGAPETRRAPSRATPS
jgi:AcrR family transcriptional regulator